MNTLVEIETYFDSNPEFLYSDIIELSLFRDSLYFYLEFFREKLSFLTCFISFAIVSFT